MTDWTKPAAYETPRKRKAKKRNPSGGWFEAAALLAAFCLGFGS